MTDEEKQRLRDAHFCVVDCSTDNHGRNILPWPAIAPRHSQASIAWLRVVTGEHRAASKRTKKQRSQPMSTFMQHATEYDAFYVGETTEGTTILHPDVFHTEKEHYTLLHGERWLAVRWQKSDL